MLKELIEKRARLWEQAKAILDKAEAEEHRQLVAEEQVAFDAIHADMESLKATIDRLERQEQVTRELEASRGRKTEPAKPVEDRAAAASASGDSTPAVYGASRYLEHSESDRLEGFRTWLLAGSDERTKLTAHQLEVSRRVGYDLNMKQMVIRLAPRAMRRISEAENWQYRAQSVSSGGGGGFTVPDELMRSLEVALLSYGGMRSVATVFRTDSGADLPIPNANDTAQEGVILAENTQVAQQDVVFTQLVIQAFKYSSKMILVSVELLQDNAINLAQFLGQALGDRIGRITNRHFTVGTGSGQPNGIVTAATLGKTGTTGQTTSVTYDDLVDLEHSVDPAYRIGASWMFSDSTLKALKKLKDTTGRPMFVPGVAVSNPDTILGYPFTINQHMAPMTANAKSILFGALSKYLIRDTAQVTLLRLDERFADFHQVAFLAFSRHDGDLLDAGTHPVAYYANSAT
jgi:HK97 family phage major capsid protein